MKSSGSFPKPLTTKKPLIIPPQNEKTRKKPTKAQKTKKPRPPKGH